MDRKIRKPKLCILAEGYEEEAYLNKILSFPNCLRDKYDVTIVNAKGRDKLINRYQNKFNSNIYQDIYIFGDGDNDPNYIKKIINGVANIRGDNNEVFIYVNPVTLQIVLSHFGKVCLTKVGKKSNSALVENFTGIKKYEAREEQVDQMMKLIKIDSLKMMVQAVYGLDNDFCKSPSSNAKNVISKIFDFNS